MGLQGKGYLKNGVKTIVEVDDDIDNLRCLLNHYGPFDPAQRPQKFVRQNFPGGYDLEIIWMFVKSIFITL